MPSNLFSPSRRLFCRSTIAVGASLSGGGVARAAMGSDIQPHQAFASSFSNVPETFGPTSVRFDRPLPAGLKGTLYRNGPAKMQRGDTRYQHWFDGDGMVHAFALTDNAVRHQARMVRTERLVAEQQAGRYLWGGFGTSFPGGRPVQRPDNLNAGNISVLPLDDEILALWEAGSAWRLRSDSLQTIGRKVFSADTDRLPFSAHPRVDPAGRIWNFGYMSGSGKLVLYDLKANGMLHRVSLIDAPNADMVHDFAITENFLVFILMPLRFKTESNSSQMAFADRLHWDANSPVHILLVDKSTLTIAQRFEMPPFFAFHFGNAWEDGDTVHVEVARAGQYTELMTQIVQATTGQPADMSTAQPMAAELVLNRRNGQVRATSMPTSGIDFPRYDQRLTGQPTQQLFMLGRSPDMQASAFGFNTVTALHRDRDSEQRYSYGVDTLAEEHVFVAPPADSSGSGWLIGTAYNWRGRFSMISVFDAAHLDDGPLAQARLPYALPLGLHGQFVSA